MPFFGQHWYAALLLLLLSSTVTIQADSRCNQPLLDGQRFRVINRYFSASGSLNESHQPYQARLTGEGWCSNMLGFDIYDPWLQVEFGTEVKVFSIKIASAPNLPNHFVKQFKVQSCDDYCDSSSRGVDSPILESNFSANSTNRDIGTIVNLTTAAVGKIFRIVPVRWMTATPCLRIELYGCLYTPVCSVTQVYTANGGDFNLTDTADGANLSLLFQTSAILTSLMLSLNTQGGMINFSNGSRTYQDFNGTKVFNISEVFTFWSPPLFVDSVLNIDLIGIGTVSNISAYGCNETQRVIPTDFDPPLSPTITTSPSRSPTATTIVVTSYLILIAGIPIAVVTIVFVAILTVSCIWCSCYARRHTNKKIQNVVKNKELEDSTLRRLDNDLYQQELGDSTLRRLDNELYHESNSCQDGEFVTNPGVRAESVSYAETTISDQIRVHSAAAAVATTTKQSTTNQLHDQEVRAGGFSKTYESIQ